MLERCTRPYGATRLYARVSSSHVWSGLGVDQRLEYRPGDRRHPAPALGERIDGPGLALPLHPAHQRGRANLEAGGDDRVRLGARLVRTHGTYPELSGIRIRHARNRSQRRSQLK